MFLCPHCGSNDIRQESVDTGDKSVSRIDYSCSLCSWSQSSLFIMHNEADEQPPKGGLFDSLVGASLFIIIYHFNKRIECSAASLAQTQPCLFFF
jgi:hypothetical protein